jgi:hypothetical protein
MAALRLGELAGSAAGGKFPGFSRKNREISSFPARNRHSSSKT